MPEFFHKNLEHRPIPPQEEALDVILEKELIKESGKKVEDWIEENAEDFQEITR